MKIADTTVDPMQIKAAAALLAQVQQDAEIAADARIGIIWATQTLAVAVEVTEAVEVEVLAVAAAVVEDQGGGNRSAASIPALQKPVPTSFPRASRTILDSTIMELTAAVEVVGPLIQDEERQNYSGMVCFIVNSDCWRGMG